VPANGTAIYSMTSSARMRRASGNSSPSALAVFWLITNSNLAGCSTGISLGLAPLRILVTMSADCRQVSERLGP
jgi:hypothetical protein